MSKKKEFSILKWVVFPANSITLAGIIAWFNLTVFGWDDGLPYSIIVAMIGVFSIIINKYTESENRSLARAAFVFEIFLTVALIINAAFSISVQRKMSVARMGEQSQASTIEQISKLKGSRTQREALKKMDKQESAQGVFGHYENILFWIMVGELALYAVSAFTLFAIAKLIEGSKVIVIPDEFPAELDTEKRSPARRAELAKTPVSYTQKKDTGKTHESFDLTGLKRLRETLKEISFYHPGLSFKADVKSDCVWIRAMRANQGTQETIHSVRAKVDILNDALTMAHDAFRFRLEAFLRENGFEI